MEMTDLVAEEGLEPPTHGLEIRGSTSRNVVPDATDGGRVSGRTGRKAFYFASILDGGCARFQAHLATLLRSGQQREGLDDPREPRKRGPTK